MHASVKSLAACSADRGLFCPFTGPEDSVNAELGSLQRATSREPSERYFWSGTESGRCLAYAATCNCQNTTWRPLTADAAEADMHPQSRSSRLEVLEKLQLLQDSSIHDRAAAQRYCMNYIRI